MASETGIFRNELQALLTSFSIGLPNYEDDPKVMQRVGVTIENSIQRAAAKARRSTPEGDGQ